MNTFTDIIEKITRRQLCLFILGLIVAAFFAIVAGMTACIVPVLFLAFLIEFVKLWNGGTFNLIDAACVVAGGLVINIFTLM